VLAHTWDPSMEILISPFRVKQGQMSYGASMYA